MATVGDRRVQKISVVIKDYVNKTKYRDAFFSWTRISVLFPIRQKIGIERFYFKKEWFHEGETEIVL